jgi:hypothetical protein
MTTRKYNGLTVKFIIKKCSIEISVIEIGCRVVISQS